MNPVAFSAGTWYNNNNKNPGKIAETSRGENMKHKPLPIGETSCNGVHGKNRLASNSLLESLVFARRAATHAMEEYTALPEKTFDDILQNDTLTNLTESYHKELLEAIEKEKEKTNHE